MKQFKEYIDEMVLSKSSMVNMSPQLYKAVKELNVKAGAVHNQIKMDGHSKEADKIYLKMKDALNMINDLYSDKFKG